MAKLIPLLPASLKDHLEEITTHMEMAAAGDKQDPVQGMLRSLASEI